VKRSPDTEVNESVVFSRTVVQSTEEALPLHVPQPLADTVVTLPIEHVSVSLF
jgi:hypothetical protein